jgi:hypothetical protein
VSIRTSVAVSNMSTTHVPSAAPVESFVVPVMRKYVGG